MREALTRWVSVVVCYLLMLMPACMLCAGRVCMHAFPYGWELLGACSMCCTLTPSFPCLLACRSLRNLALLQFWQWSVVWMLVLCARRLPSWLLCSLALRQRQQRQQRRQPPLTWHRNCKCCWQLAHLQVHCCQRPPPCRHLTWLEAALPPLWQCLDALRSVQTVLPASWHSFGSSLLSKHNRQS
jgi:hypothetical protein